MKSRRIFITGASSGIGEHLAYHYACQGAQLGLAARRCDLLEQIARKCQSLGARVQTFTLDVTHQADCRKAATAFREQFGGIDLLIANAGKSGNDYLDSGNSTRINEILTINILGITNIVYPFAPTLIEQQSGQVALVSSIAGIRGLPGRAGYAASKIAVKTLADGLRYSFKKHNVKVTTIYPGFIRTPMTANRNSIMPFLMDVEPAAVQIARAIAAGKRNYMFPWPWRVLRPLLKAVPDCLVSKVVK